VIAAIAVLTIVNLAIVALAAVGVVRYGGRTRSAGRCVTRR
jgi:hypothetical protein